MDDGRAVTWVGTYAEKGGEGIYPISRSASGEWLVGEPLAEARNASFGVWSPRHRLHFLVDEQAGTLAAYDPEDEWAASATAATGGSQPCYVALNPDETLLALANYDSGSLALFALDLRTGLQVDPPQVRGNRGQGPNPERQEGPHAHCALFHPAGGWLFQTDLGTDEILAFPLDPGLGEPHCAFRAPPGSGPRHLLFHHGGAAFLISELASTIDLLEWDGRQFTSRQQVSTLPPGAGDSLGGHIGINAGGDRIYATNRGHDSVAVFAFDGQRLAPIQHIGCGGASPRHFLLREQDRTLLVANEESGTVTGFHVAADGCLEPAGIDLALPGAAFLFDHSAAI